MNQHVIECVDVTKRYGDTVAVAGVSLSLRHGEVLSVLGPSGCGKTTLLRLMAGFEAADSGHINVQGSLVSGAGLHVPPERRNVGMVFQEYALFPHLTVAQNVSFGLRRMSRDERRRRLAEVIDLVRLAGLEGRYPHELSGGQQQRVALARTLAPRPITVLLDEPFSNLDARMRSEVRLEVAAILRQGRVSAVFVTHDREEAFAMADRIAVMREGRIEQLDTPNAVYRAPATPFVARMTGNCDFLAAEIRNGRAVTEIGALAWIGGDEAHAEGACVDLLVQVDDLQLRQEPGGNAVVVSREFRGDETMLVVGLPSGSTVRCRERSYSTAAPGMRVTLSAVRPAPFLAFRRSVSGP